MPGNESVKDDSSGIDPGNENDGVLPATFLLNQRRLSVGQSLVTGGQTKVVAVEVQFPDSAGSVWCRQIERKKAAVGYVVIHVLIGATDRAMFIFISVERSVRLKPTAIDLPSMRISRPGRCTPLSVAMLTWTAC